MKGKIRVYCRARPMSRTELERVGNKFSAFHILGADFSR